MTDKSHKELKRTLTSFQSTGRIGRSTLKQGLISWFGYAGIEFSAIDADPEHHTLSSWYPHHTTQQGYREEKDLLPIVNTLGKTQVQIIDFPSQETQSILKAFDRFNVLQIMNEKKTRLTVFIFASDERAAMMSAHQIVSHFDSRVDYVIVENPERFTSRIFYSSKLAETLKALKAPTIEIPRITGTTMESLDDASKKTRKPLTFREAEPLLEIGSQYELEHWRNQLFAQFEDLSSVLLPSADLIKLRIERPKQKKVLVPVDPFDL